MKIILAVAAGGAIGAVARYLVMVLTGRLLGMGFPWGTLTVNVVGSFLLGALVDIMALRWSVGQEMRAFLVVGVMGAFTTFSTFSLDVVTHAQRGEWAVTSIYVAASVTLSIGGFLLGMATLRAVLT